MPSSSTAALLLALVAASVAPSSRAAVYTDTYSQQTTFTTPVTRGDCAGCVVTLDHTDAFPGGTSTVTGQAMASYGLLEAAVRTTGTGAWPSSHIYVDAGFVDSFTIDAPALTGQVGHFTAEVAMPYTTSRLEGPQSGASFDAGLTINDAEGWGLIASNSSNGSSVYTAHDGTQVANGTPMILDVQFVYGQPNSIRAHLDLDAFGVLGQNGGTYDAWMDASHSLAWEGIRQVTDRDGHVVSAWSVTSDSGTDWSRNFMTSPVPEPGGLALLAAGLAFIGWRRRGATT